MGEITLEDKLKGFPNVYYLNLQESVDRRIYMDSQAKKYPINFVRFPVENHFRNPTEFECDKNYEMDPLKPNSDHNGIHFQLAVTMSYIKAFKQWYDSTYDQFAIFCDDDMDFSLLENWNFTWEEFMNNLPRNWEAVQLIRMRKDLNLDSNWTTLIDEEIEPIQLKRKLRPGLVPNFCMIKRNINQPNCGGSIYLLTREYVAKVLDKFYKNDKFSFMSEVGFTPGIRGVENTLLFEHQGVYNIPLFVERAQLLSTLKHTFPYMNVDGNSKFYHDVHVQSQAYYSYFWMKHGKSITLDMIIKDL